MLSPDGRYVAIGLDEAKDNLRIFDAATGDLLRVLTSGTGATSIAFAPDSRHVLTGNRDNIGRIIDVETGETRELIGHTNIIWGAAFSPDGRFALTGSQDRTARLWDVATGAEVRRFASHQYSAIARSRLLGRRPDHRDRQLRWRHPAHADRPPGPRQLDMRPPAA